MKWSIVHETVLAKKWLVSCTFFTKPVAIMLTVASFRTLSVDCILKGGSM